MKISTALLLTLGCCLSAVEASHLSDGDALLNKGEFKAAMKEYDAAIRSDHTNFQPFYKRGIAQAAIGLERSAIRDFQKVLELNPSAAGVNKQLGKLYLKIGDFELANKFGDSEVEAQLAKYMTEYDAAMESQRKGEWEACGEHAQEALKISPKDLRTRRIRIQCEISENKPREALVDLAKLSQVNPNDLSTYVTMARLHYYKFHEVDLALQQTRKCLELDPDYRGCRELSKQMRRHEKIIGKFFNTQKKAPSNPIWAEMEQTLIEEGMLADVDAVARNELKIVGLGDGIESDVVNDLIDQLCLSFVNQKRYEDGVEICQKAESRLRDTPVYTPAVLLKAHLELDKENFEEAVSILKQTIEELQKEQKPVDERLQRLYREAEVLLQRSKNKDYYKILGVSRNADEKEIKKAYRAKAKEYHPDKYKGDLTEEQVAKKMHEINEAYEVLSDAELKSSFDNGQDPNAHGQPRRPGGPHFNFNGGGFPADFAEQFMRQQQRGGARVRFH